MTALGIVYSDLTDIFEVSLHRCICKYFVALSFPCNSLNNLFLLLFSLKENNIKIVSLTLFLQKSLLHRCRLPKFCKLHVVIIGEKAKKTIFFKSYSLLCSLENAINRSFCSIIFCGKALSTIIDLPPKPHVMNKTRIG